MGKRSRVSKPAGLRDQPPGAETGPPFQGTKNRRIRWAATLVVAALALSCLAIGSVAIYRRLFAGGPISGSVEDPRRQEVEELIRRYFRTWSSQDMQGYADCFAENASVQYIDAQRKVLNFTLPAFLASQGDVFRAGQKENEVPLSLDIRFESRLARVVVYWKLTAGSREVFGYDHFTVMKCDGKWKIVNLVFYETKRSG